MPQNLISETRYSKRGYLLVILKKLRKWMEEHTAYQGEIIINEWNFTPNPLDLINDTAFKAPYFVENVLDAATQVDAIAYWTFSDIFDEVRHKGRLFHGGIGFLTEVGLKKPIYYAIELLQMVSGEVVERGKNMLAVKGVDGTISILLYNYCELYSGETKTEDSLFYDRYQAFQNRQMEVQILLEGAEGDYQKNTYRIHQKEGSIFDEWLKMGAPKALRPAIMKQLEYKSLYGFRTENVKLSSSEIIFEELEAHEVKLVQWIPQAYTDI